MLTKRDLSEIKGIVKEVVEASEFTVVSTVNKAFNEFERGNAAEHALMNKKIDKLTVAVDGFANNQKKFDAELAAHQAAHTRYEERFLKLENR